MIDLDTEQASPKPLGTWAIVLGVVFPGITILIELVTHMCANTFFDPLPTAPMTFLVSAVPLANWHLWHRLEKGQEITHWSARLFGAAVIVAALHVLVFLPIYPISLIGIILWGIGLLPFAPLFALFVTVRGINRIAKVQPNVWQQAWIGIVIGAVLLLLADLPTTATRYAVELAERDNEPRAVKILRWIGSDNELLHYAYGTTGRAGGLGSILLLGDWGFGVFGRSDWGRDDTVTARRLYYRSTGTTFNSVEKPKDIDRDQWWSRRDNAQGGSEVAGRVDTLSLASSRIDGSISAEANVAYGEWTFEVANSGSTPGEARFTMALPEGAVASRATLWINGEPKEASIAGRGETRAAYQAVVRRQRDPLLVTTSGSGRLLVQAFPVPSQGQMKFRIGYSAPLIIAQDGNRTIALPAIVEENFKIPATFSHTVWMEGDISPQRDSWTADKLAEGKVRMRRMVADKDLRTARPILNISAVASPVTTYASVPAFHTAPAQGVIQTIKPAAPSQPERIAIVVDSSVANASAGSGLAQALEAIAPGTIVGLAIAGDDLAMVKPAPWSASQKALFETALAKTNYMGGADNVPALTAAMGQSPSTVLWIHGPQPVDFPASSAQLEQWLDRIGTSRPKLVRYQAVPGRAFTMQDQPLFEAARWIAPLGNVTADMKALLGDLSSQGQRWQVTREASDAKGASGSPHIVRLWAADKIAASAPYSIPQRKAAVAQAWQLNIITSVSGAVVLDQDQEFKRDGLPVPTPDEVPSVPEPEVWALLMIVIMFAGLALRRRRQRSQLAT